MSDQGARGGAGRNRKPPLFRPAFAPDRDESARARLAAWRARYAENAPARPSEKERGYDAQWRALRAAVLAAEPNCRACAAQGIVRRAKMVDHIESIARRPELRLARTNLQPLCWPCHNGKTNRRDGGLGKPKPSR